MPCIRWYGGIEFFSLSIGSSVRSFVRPASLCECNSSEVFGSIAFIFGRIFTISVVCSLYKFSVLSVKLLQLSC